jgi:hypothetical protein
VLERVEWAPIPRTGGAGDGALTPHPSPL